MDDHQEKSLIDPILTQKAEQFRHTQQKFIGRETVEYETNYFHDYFREIPFLRVKALLDSTGRTLDGCRVLVASCGEGIDVHYLRKSYPNAVFHVCDYAQNAVELAKRSLGVDEGSIQDNERLTFEDNEFDYSFVAASLHHLPRPILGLYELLRVSKKGLIVIEPNDSLATRIATRLGIATEIEDSGNYVFRLSRHDVYRISRSLFYAFTSDVFFAIHRVATSRLEFRLLQVVNGIANIVLPSQGNYIAFLLHKPSN